MPEETHLPESIRLTIEEIEKELDFAYRRVTYLRQNLNLPKETRNFNMQLAIDNITKARTLLDHIKSATLIMPPEESLED